MGWDGAACRAEEGDRGRRESKAGRGEREKVWVGAQPPASAGELLGRVLAEAGGQGGGATLIEAVARLQCRSEARGRSVGGARRGGKPGGGGKRPSKGERGARAGGPQAAAGAGTYRGRGGAHVNSTPHETGRNQGERQQIKQGRGSAGAKGAREGLGSEHAGPDGAARRRSAVRKGGWVAGVRRQQAAQGSAAYCRVKNAWSSRQ